MKKSENLNISNLSEGLKNYLYSLQKTDEFEFLPLRKPNLEYGSKLNLGFSCFAIKSFYIIDEVKNFENDKLNKWVEYLNSYQVQDTQFLKGSFVDEALVEFYNKHNFKNNIKDITKLSVNLISSKKYETNGDKLLKAINAESKQAISTLYQIGAKNKIELQSAFISNIDVLNYLYSLNWNYPWNAGAQFASLCVYSSTQNHGYDGLLLNFIEKILNKDTGSYFTTFPNHTREVINGAMKVISGLDWLGHEVHLPKQLIDFCLKNKPIFEGCDIVDFVYVLYKCSNITDYRNEEIQTYFLDLLNHIQTLYIDNEGGYSYFRNKSQTHYYGVPISSNQSFADIHGTTLIIWALAMIFETCKIKKYKWKILKP